MQIVRNRLVKRKNAGTVDDDVKRFLFFEIERGEYIHEVSKEEESFLNRSEKDRIWAPP